MAKEISNELENFKEIRIPQYIDTAQKLKPTIFHQTLEPKTIINIQKDSNDYFAITSGLYNDISNHNLSKGESICLDFCEHLVGHLSINFDVNIGIQDAPLFVKIKLGEHLCEIAEDSSNYNGLLSKSWIQEDYFHIDVLPYTLELTRRYAFRYLEITIIDTSPSYTAKINKIKAISQTSANIDNIEKVNINDERLKRLDDISITTMRDCMQDVFEDGPKRDRRLWIGDLRLQALTNYVTFRDTNLVTRCLYLFAGLQQNEGRVGACLYTEPKPMVSSTFLFDYSLFFISCLYDYYNFSKDFDTLQELSTVAFRQLEIAKERLLDNGLVKDSDDWWCFVDWHEDLNKQAPAQAILIYTAKQALEIAKLLNDKEKINSITNLIEITSKAAKDYLWDNEIGLFISGNEKQISYASQIWFVLANVFDNELNIKILKKIKNNPDSIGMVTPYMYHHYIDALISTGMYDEAKKQMVDYWGKMADLGADCFWECFNPNDVTASPYNSRVINSYCHAWSGTPSYFIRKYFI